MKIFLEPSLERFTLVKIVTTIWNQRDVRSLIPYDMPEMPEFRFRFYFFLNRHENWQKIENKVMDKVSDLRVPEILREKIKCFIKPIGLQILKWIEYHCGDEYLQLNLPAEFCWTSHGLINKKKTAEMMIKDDKMDITDRYRLACIYCLENNICELWNKMPPKLRESFTSARFKQVEIFIFWEKQMLDNKFRLRGNSTITLQSIFESSALCGNKAATEYFLEKLTPAEREESLARIAKDVKDAEVFCYLLMQIDEESQKYFFKNHPSLKLEFFLTWPFQSLFVKAVNLALDFIQYFVLNSLLSKVVQKIKLGDKDWDYQDLIRILWQECPCHSKTLFISCFIHGFLLPDLVQIEDKKSIKLINQEISSAQKDILVYEHTFHDVCESLFLKQNWNMLGFLIHEFVSSDEVMIKFKKKFEKRPNIKNNLRLNEHKWNLLFSFR